MKMYRRSICELKCQNLHIDHIQGKNYKHPLEESETLLHHPCPQKQENSKIRDWLVDGCQNRCPLCSDKLISIKLISTIVSGLNEHIGLF